MRKAPAMLQHWAPLRGRSYVVMPDGRFQVDPAKKHITPFTLVSEPEEVTVPGAQLMCPGVFAGGNVDKAVIFPIDNKGPFEVCYSSFHAEFTEGPDTGKPTDQFMVVIFDPDMEPLLMNREIHARTIAGGFGSSIGGGIETASQSAAGRPLVWPESFFMDPEANGKALFMGYRNLSIYAIKVKWAFHGIRYYDVSTFEKARKEKERIAGPGKVSFPYFYTTDTNVRLAAGASFDFHVRLTDEADVEIFKMAKYSDAPFLWRIQEKAGKRQLDNAGPGATGFPNGVHSDFGWGDGEFPFIPYESFYYEQNSKVIITFVNSLSSEQNRIFPTLVCRKIHHANGK
jgi:hypothetical protein